MPKTIKRKLMDYIEAEVIASTILDGLDAEDAEKTFANAKKVWDDFTATELADGVQSSIRALVEKHELS